MHAHLLVRARVDKRAAITNVPAFDDPYLASGRADVGSELVGNQAQRVTQVRTAPDLIENLVYSVFSGCRHLKNVWAYKVGGLRNTLCTVILVCRHVRVNYSIFGGASEY